MTAKTAGLGLIHKLLMFFVVINIIGDIGNVAFWWAALIRVRHRLTLALSGLMQA